MQVVVLCYDAAAIRNTTSSSTKYRDIEIETAPKADFFVVSFVLLCLLILSAAMTLAQKLVGSDFLSLGSLGSKLVKKDE